MKASYVLSMAAVALLGAGALYAPLNPLDPEIASVCTERNPIYAQKGTEYVNALGIELTGAEVKSAYEEVQAELSSIYDAGKDASGLAGGLDGKYPHPDPADGLTLTERIDAVETMVIGENPASGVKDKSLFRNTVSVIEIIDINDDDVYDLPTATSKVSNALGTKAPITENDTIYAKVTKLQSAVEQPSDVEADDRNVLANGAGIASTDSLQKRIVDVGSAICANGQINDGAAALSPGQDTSMAKRVIAVGALIDATSPFAGLDAGEAVSDTTKAVTADNSLYKKMITQQKAVMAEGDTTGSANVNDDTDITTLETRIDNVQLAIAADGGSIAARAVAVGALLSDTNSDPFGGTDLGDQSLSEQIIAQQQAVMTEGDGAGVIDTPTGNQTITPLETRISNVQAAIAADGTIGDVTIGAADSIAKRAVALGALIGTTNGGNDVSDPFANGALYTQLNDLMGTIDSALANSITGTVTYTSSYSTANVNGITTVQGVLNALAAVVPTIAP